MVPFTEHLNVFWPIICVSLEEEYSHISSPRATEHFCPVGKRFFYATGTSICLPSVSVVPVWLNQSHGFPIAPLVITGKGNLFSVIAYDNAHFCTS